MSLDFNSYGSTSFATLGPYLGKRIQRRLKQKKGAGRKLSHVERHLLSSRRRIKNNLFAPGLLNSLLTLLSSLARPLPITLFIAFIFATEASSSAGWFKPTIEETKEASLLESLSDYQKKILAYIPNFLATKASLTSDIQNNDLFSALTFDSETPYRKPIPQEARNSRTKSASLEERPKEDLKQLARRTFLNAHRGNQISSGTLKGTLKPPAQPHKMKNPELVQFLSGLIAVYYPGEKNPGGLASAIVETSLEQQIDPIYVASVIAVESGFKRTARSHVGARGLMQLMPATARIVAKSLKLDPNNLELSDPRLNIRLGINYLKGLERQYHGNRHRALAAYNWGPGNVSKASKNLKRMPRSVKNYATKILSKSSKWRSIYNSASNAA